MNRYLQRALWAAMMAAAMGITTNAMAAAPTVTSITPNLSDTAGGETVEIVGTNFLVPLASAVSFGGVPAASFTVLSNTLISAVTPAHVKSCYAVTVTNPDGVGSSAADAFTSTTHNRVLQVSVRMTLGQNVRIAWAAGTNNDDTLATPLVGAAHPAGDIAPYIWFVRDCDFGPPGTDAAINLSSVYTTDGPGAVFAPGDPENAHTLIIENLSLTGSAIDIGGVVSNSVPSLAGGTIWTPTGPGADAFEMQANLSGGVAGGQVLTTGPATLLFDEMAAAATSTLHLQVSTPTSSTTLPGVEHVVTVSLIGSAD